MRVSALSKQVRISPRKVNEVASLVRGRTVEDALVILDHTPRRAAPIIAKVIESARANAKNNHNLKEDTLVIDTLDIGGGPDYKRHRPAAHGRALPYRIRTTHIRVTVEGEEGAKSTTKKKSTAKVKSSPATKEAPKDEAKKEEKA